MTLQQALKWENGNGQYYDADAITALAAEVRRLQVELERAKLDRNRAMLVVRAELLPTMTKIAAERDALIREADRVKIECRAAKEQAITSLRSAEFNHGLLLEVTAERDADKKKFKTGIEAINTAFRLFLSNQRLIPGRPHGQMVGCETLRLDYSGRQAGDVMDAIHAAHLPGETELLEYAKGIEL